MNITPVRIKGAAPSTLCIKKPQTLQAFSFKSMGGFLQKIIDTNYEFLFKELSNKHLYIDITHDPLFGNRDIKRKRFFVILSNGLEKPFFIREEFSLDSAKTTLNNENITMKDVVDFFNNAHIDDRLKLFYLWSKPLNKVISKAITGDGGAILKTSHLFEFTERYNETKPNLSQSKINPQVLSMVGDGYKSIFEALQINNIKLDYGLNEKGIFGVILNESGSDRFFSINDNSPRFFSSDIYGNYYYFSRWLNLGLFSLLNKESLKTLKKIPIAE